jgi:hypothetical protein
MTTLNKLALGLVVVAAACSGPQAKPSSTIVNEGSDTAESCCCKSNPLTSEDGKPAFELGINRMECSSKQGECVADVQCQPQAAAPEPTPAP